MWTRSSDFDRMFTAMDLLRSRMNRVFTDYDRLYGKGYEWTVTEGAPRTNLYDAGDHFEIRAELAGITKEDLNVKIQGNYLEVSGKRKPDAPEGYTTHRVERGTTAFSRSFTLPADVDAEQVTANLKDGILTLILPKAEAAKLKQVTIN